jgi:hypothetical protein
MEILTIFLLNTGIPGLWILIRIGYGFNDIVDLDPGSEFQRQMKQKLEFFILFLKFYNKKVCCGSGFIDFLDPDPDWAEKCLNRTCIDSIRIHNPGIFAVLLSLKKRLTPGQT